MQQAPQRTVRATVKYSDRGPVPTADKFVGILFLVSLSVSLILGAYTWGNANVILFPKDGVCPAGYDHNGGETVICWSKQLSDDYDKCVQDHPNGRRLSEMEFASYNATSGGFSVFGLLKHHAEIPGTIIPLTAVVGLIWMGLLTYFSKPIVWFTCLFKVFCWFMASALCMKYNTDDGALTENAIIYAVIGLATLFVIVSKRAAINRAAEFMEMACLCIRENPSIMLATGLVKLVFIIYLFFYNLFLINGYLMWEVKWSEPTDDYSFDVTCDDGYCPGCMPSISRIAYGSQAFSSFVFIWTGFFFAGIKLVITAMITASWFWGQPEQSTRRALWTACTSSAPTVAFSTLVTAIAQYLQRMIKRGWFGLIVRCLWGALVEILKSFQKYTLITHALTGDGFVEATKDTMSVLKRNFVNAVVTDKVGLNVLRLGAYVFSIGMGFAAWAWADDACNLSTLNPSSWKDSTVGFDGAFYLCLVFFLILTYVPMLTILVVGLCSEMIHNSVVGLAEAGTVPQDPTTPFLVALFIAAICNIIFNFFGDIVLNAMDTIFLCHAIGAEEKRAALPNHPEVLILLNSNPANKATILAHGGDPTAYTTLPAQQQPQMAVAVAYPAAHAPGYKV